MKEYIEREAVLRRMQKIATEAWKMRIKANVETVWNEAQDVLRFFPAADVRPVVLCRDCIHLNKRESNMNGFYRCDRYDAWQDESNRVYMPLDGFCCYGQKKEEES